MTMNSSIPRCVKGNFGIGLVISGYVVVANYPSYCPHATCFTPFANNIRGCKQRLGSLNATFCRSTGASPGTWCELARFGHIRASRFFLCSPSSTGCTFHKVLNKMTAIAIYKKVHPVTTYKGLPHEFETECPKISTKI